MRILPALALVLTLPAWVLPVSARGPADAPACAVGRKVLEEWLPRVSAEDVLVTDELLRHWPFTAGGSPLPEGIAAGPSNLFVACPHLRAEVGPPARFATEEERAAVRGSPFQKPLPAVIRGFTAPQVDEGGRAALVQVVFECPGLCGSGVVLRYERRKGRWVRAEVVAQWFS